LKKTKFGNLSRDEVLAQRDSVKSDLDAFLKRSNADLAPLLQEALQPTLAAYEELKARNGRVDFLDLLVKARDLFRDNPSVQQSAASSSSSAILNSPSTASDALMWRSITKSSRCCCRGERCHCTSARAFAALHRCNHSSTQLLRLPWPER
jgi:hypothetical protein